MYVGPTVDLTESRHNKDLLHLVRRENKGNINNNKIKTKERKLKTASSHPEWHEDKFADNIQSRLPNPHSCFSIWGFKFVASWEGEATCACFNHVMDEYTWCSWGRLKRILYSAYGYELCIRLNKFATEQSSIVTEPRNWKILLHIASLFTRLMRSAADSVTIREKKWHGKRMKRRGGVFAPARRACPAREET